MKWRLKVTRQTRRVKVRVSWTSVEVQKFRFCLMKSPVPCYFRSCHPVTQQAASRSSITGTMSPTAVNVSNCWHHVDTSTCPNTRSPIEIRNQESYLSNQFVARWRTNTNITHFPQLFDNPALIRLKWKHAAVCSHVTCGDRGSALRHPGVLTTTATGSCKNSREWRENEAEHGACGAADPRQR